MFYSEQSGGFHDGLDPLPSDAKEISDELYIALRDGQGNGKCIKADADGYPVLVDAVQTTEQLQAMFVASIQHRLDSWAQTRNYDGILSACTYATSSVERFQQEGQRAVELRDATWAAAYAILGEVLQGTRPMPSSIADIEADLPALEWPQ